MSDDRLQKWAFVAEVAGAVAVVATLGFLAFEMRGNTNAVQAQTYQALMSELNDLRAAAMLDPDLLGLEGKLSQEGWESLSFEEQRHVRIPNLILWGIYESAYYANERGVLGDGEWERFRFQICRAVTERDMYWDPEGHQPMPELLTPVFVEYVETSC